MLIIINGIFLVAYLLYTVLRRKFSSQNIVILSIVTILLILQIVNISTQRKEFSLSEKTFGQISEINWSDEDELKNLGFSEHDEYYISHYDSDDYMCSIIVQKTKATPENLKYTNGIGYEIYEERLGIFDFKRLFSSENHVYRRYFLYIDSVTIKVTEDNIENRPPSFAQFIEKIS